MSKEILTEAFMLSDGFKDGTVGKAAIAGAAVIGLVSSIAVAKPWGRVPEGHVALPERFDAVRRDRDGKIKNGLKGPGLRHKPSLKGSLKLVDIRMQAIDLDDIDLVRNVQLVQEEDSDDTMPAQIEPRKITPDQIEPSQNGQIWTVKPTIFLRVPWDEEEVYKYLYAASGTDDRNQIIKTTCADALAQIYEGIHDQNIFNRGLVDARLYNKTAEEIHSYGAELVGLKLRGIAPHPVERQRSGMIEAGMPNPPLPVDGMADVVDIASEREKSA